MCYLLCVFGCVWEHGGDVEHDLAAVERRVDGVGARRVGWNRQEGM